MTAPLESNRGLASYEQAFRQFFEPRVFVHLTFHFALLFTMLSLFFWLGQRIGTSVTWYRLASTGTTAAIALIGTGFSVTIQRYRWSKDTSNSSNQSPQPTAGRSDV